MFILNWILGLMTLQNTVFIAPINSAEVSDFSRDQVVYRAFEPIYELQLTAWPTNMQPDELTASVFEDEVYEYVTIDEPVDVPFYEDQIVVFPDGINPQHITELPNSVTDSYMNTELNPIVVIHNSHITHPDGTSEYKLILSNGLVDYKKIYNKIVDGKVVQAQNGFYSLPAADDKTKVGILHYISDENGNRVYKEEISRKNLANMEFIQSNW